MPISYLKDLNKKVLFSREVYDNSNRKTIFGDCPIHTNSYGNHLLAQKIYKQLLLEYVMQTSEEKDNTYLQKGYWLGVEEELQLNEYLSKIVNQYKNILNEKNKIGAIVMNCNPFTKGHRYLIEEAKKQVDYLFIFVVEENKSFFSFEERFEMVEIGVEDIKNVIVLPSGKFILSFQTLPTYFDKEEHNEVQVDAVNDLEIFARYVAKELNIKVRFVGEEPIDMVTKQYNQQMFQTLEEFDIEVIEIPRKQVLGCVISASNVRAALKNKNEVVLEQMLPNTTRKYLDKMGY
jgi:[citrate (pro-3S)-lyase] ligase